MESFDPFKQAVIFLGKIMLKLTPNSGIDAQNISCSFSIYFRDPVSLKYTNFCLNSLVYD